MPSAVTLRPARARAMPPEARRAAIVAATLPLLLETGADVTTRQIAEAAGIAEGTIFRAFPDKDALMDAVMEAAFDPAPLEASLAAIDRTRPFEERLLTAVDLVQRRLTDLWRLMSIVGPRRPPHAHPTDLVGLAALFEPERDRLRLDPAAAARLLRGLTLAVSHPALAADGPMSPAEIVSLMLDGIRIREEPSG